MLQSIVLIAPQLAVLLTAVGALVLRDAARLPKVSLPFTVIGLLVATGLAVRS